jgi:glycerol-3-phosphate acyltransferase PlsX
LRVLNSTFGLSLKGTKVLLVSEVERAARVTRIAIDAMGGDYAPGEVVKGAVLAAQKGGVEAILISPIATLEAELAKYDTAHMAIRCVRADEFIEEGEHPALALRRKRNASIVVAAKLVKAGEADALLSTGSTGAVVASALYILGPLEGMERPVVGGPFVGFAPNTLVVDLRGNVDCKPYHLLSFATIGCVYAQKLLNIANPSVALLSTGAEEGKGNELVRESYPLFQKSGLNFIGNIEGHDILSGRANVVLCDGFVGNVLVKFCEGLGTTIAEWLKEVLRDRLPPSDIENVAADLASLTNAADTFGGGPLWDVNGIAVVAHGRSRAPEISKAISGGKTAVDSDLVGALKSELAKIREVVK